MFLAMLKKVLEDSNSEFHGNSTEEPIEDDWKEMNKSTNKQKYSTKKLKTLIAL